MYQSAPLEIKELMALYGSEGNSYPVGDEDCTSEDYDVDSESSEEGKGGRGVRSSVSLEIHGLQREPHVYFSNQEYYRRLEELKSAHLRNMAELERMYISRGRERRGEADDGGLRRNREASQSIRFDTPCDNNSGVARKLQRINSQEELDFHDTSSGSDQSELGGEDGMGELELTLGQHPTFRRDIRLSPGETTTQKQFRFQPESACAKPQGAWSRETGVRVWSSSKVTVPKPFKMMLREEERRKHRVRTRSEVELENALLRRELEELRECRKQFRASPAPAHIHLPLCKIISCRPGQRSPQSRSNSDSCNSRGSRASAAAAASPRPFHFLERERKKREAKIVAELGNLGQKEERRSFKARPLPSSVYGKRHRAESKTTAWQPESRTMCALEREVTEGQSDPSSDLEPEASQSDASPAACAPRRCRPSKPVKKQIELSIEMVKEREWAYTSRL